MAPPSTDTLECWVLHVTIIYYTSSSVMRWWATIIQHCHMMVCRLGDVFMVTFHTGGRDFISACKLCFFIRQVSVAEWSNVQDYSRQLLMI